MLLVIFTETKRRGACPKRAPVLGGWSGGRWVGPHRGTGEPEAGVQVVPLPAGALQPLTSVGTFCWAPGEGSPRPEWGMGGRRALAPLKALPREVRAETEGLGPASCWAGQPEASSSF